MPYVLKLDFASLMMCPSDWRTKPEYVELYKKYKKLVRRDKYAGSSTTERCRGRDHSR